MRVGKFSTPLGLWTVEHWAINVPSVQKPIHEDNKYVPPFQVGLSSFGQWVSSSGSGLAPEISYALWLSTGNVLSGTNDTPDNKFAYGANISGHFREIIKVGLTGYTQNNAGIQEETLLPYAEIYLPHGLTFSGEYFNQSRNMGSSDINVWYASAKWQFLPNTYFYYRRDQGDDNKRGNGKKHENNVFTLGYWPRPYVRAKLEFSTQDFDDTGKEDFNQWNAWIGVIF